MRLTQTPAEAAEIAKFKETGKKIVHRGREYDILNPPDDEHRADSPWILRSKRGDYIALTRNRPKPHLMFGINLYNGGMKCLPGWFTDKDGELKSLG